MNRKLKLSVLVLAAIVLPLLGACGGGAPANPGLINVTVETYKITLSANSAPAGKVTFHITNKASDQVHELVVIQTDLAADKLPLDADGNVDEDKITGMGEVEDVAIGASVDLALDLPAGHYVLICNIATHYHEGMHVDFTVK